ncbi:hypothetical protein HAX54_026777 [Datura stramonium]|uniref:Uncharacterized protein n=1 Tax=Datura stramonium TaxID=4076 RepID=A0ABS8V3Q5_DATST|nr:hypothetical protein [Datura stramonium]
METATSSSSPSLWGTNEQRQQELPRHHLGECGGLSGAGRFCCLGPSLLFALGQWEGLRLGLESLSTASSEAYPLINAESGLAAYKRKAERSIANSSLVVTAMAKDFVIVKLTKMQRWDDEILRD